MSIITKYVKNDNFHTTLINFIFQFKLDKDEIMAFTILSKLMSYTNGIYKKEDEFAKQKLLRYIMNYGCSGQAINDVYFLNFSLLIPSDNVIKDDYVEDAINFVLDCIYKPNIENDLFNDKLFERERKLYIEYLLNGYKNVGFVAKKNALDLLDGEGIFNKLKYKDLDNIKDLRNEDLVDFYNKYIKGYKPKIFINGNIDSLYVENIINNYISNMKLKDITLFYDYDYFYKSKEFIDKTDISNFYQSIVFMAYNVNNYSEKDKYKLFLINLLLSSGSSDLLLNHLRKQNNLVYSCGSSVFINNGLLIIKAVTSNKNIKIAKAVIEDLINKLRNIDDYCENINDIMYRLSLNLEREKDDFFKTSSNIINEYFKSDLSSEEEFEIINNIDKEELIDVINRLELIGIYTLEGNRE